MPTKADIGQSRYRLGSHFPYWFIQKKLITISEKIQVDAFEFLALNGHIGENGLMSGYWLAHVSSIIAAPNFNLDKGPFSQNDWKLKLQNICFR